MKLLFNIICFLFSILVSAQNAAELYETSISSSSSVFDEAPNGIDMSGKDNNSTEPRAFLNYIFFDSEMNYERAGFKQITCASNGSSVQVTADAFIAEKEGYLLVYLSNETQGSEVVVSWDDLEVYHGKTNVVQAQAYYPGGAIFNDYKRTASIAQNFNFN
ncbi:MAG: hypothetical protein AAF600_22595 [Bacteroidota bacterium]